MKKKIFIKIFSGFFLMILVLLIINQIIAQSFLNSFYKTVSFEYIKKFGGLLKSEIAAPLLESRFDDARKIFERFALIPGFKITVADKSGKVLDGMNDKTLVISNQQGFQIASLGKISEDTLYNEELKRTVLSVTIPVIKYGSVVYMIQIFSYASGENALLGEMFTQLLAFGVLLLVLSLILTILLSRGFSVPIYHLLNATKEVANGNFRVRVLFKTDDEFKALADNFNDMTTQMDDLFRELNEERDELKTIMYTLQGALWVIDEHDRIVFSNESFCKMARAKDPVGSPYWEYIRDNELDNVIKKIRSEKHGIIRELELEREIYLFSGVMSPLKNHIILILSNISDLKAAENFKKSLIDSVSHELKTPLTSIKGFIETLKMEEKNPEKKRYLDIIERNTNRLSEIVGDLLVYSDLENSGVIDYEKVSLLKTLKDLTSIFEKRIKEKKLAFTIDAKKDITIDADRFQLEKVFINLIDNAIKYTEKGAITIGIERQGDNVSVTVRDTGIGIPKEHLPRIFERFYVVDKSRSRSLGGTGLGLSIVKKIVQLHIGEVLVESELGVGTAITVFLPIKHG
ncbi:MAG: HAMP domain-containing protein [Brevinematales bacterium]|nr:HAMP domain-containing protein [Brevinematales bacterium]